MSIAVRAVLLPAFDVAKKSAKHNKRFRVMHPEALLFTISPASLPTLLLSA